MRLAKYTDRFLVALLSAGLGGLASMGALRIFHEWAFRTEFSGWLWMTAVHSCIVFGLFALSFGYLRPNLLSVNGIAKCVGAVVVGGLLAVLVIPWGFVLIMTGQAFITSGMATLIYVAVSAQRARETIDSGDR